MRKIILCLFSSILLLVNTVYANNVVLPDTRANVLMEAYTGKVLLEKNPNEKAQIASVTKVMTMLLVFEALEEGKISKEDIVTISEHAASMGGSQVYLETNEKQTVNDLLKAVVISSANDGAVALAEFVAGSEAQFVTMMNDKALSLGMKDTHFINACGLDENNESYSTAYDVALMSRELITKHPDVFNYSTIKQDTLIHKTKRGDEEFILNSTNKLLGNYEGITGLKTGSTSQALFCISSTATRNDMSLISVILGAPTSSDRNSDVVKTFDYGFANYKTFTVDAIDKPYAQTTVSKSFVPTVDVYLSEKPVVVIEKNDKVEITQEAHMVENLVAPLTAGTKVGEAVFKQGDVVVAQIDLVVRVDVPKATYFETLGKTIVGWF